MEKIIIQVDRSVRPVYNIRVREILHPELECIGPAEYDLLKIEPWFHSEQKEGKIVDGNTIYNYLKYTKNLSLCLNLQDGFAIKKKGIAIFSKVLKGKDLPLWPSIIVKQSGYLYVPFLYILDGEILIDWRYIGFRLNSDNPTFLHSH
ncbi:MAG: hypothetical protein WC839_00670 [Candidatus Paceibacterota bacterium]